MPANYVLLEKITVGSAGASSVTFSGIPQTGYTDLVVKASARSTYSGAGVADYANVSFNGVSTNQSLKYLYGTGSAAGSFSDTLIYPPINTNAQTANTFGNFEIYIPNYTSSNYKSLSADGVAENNATAAGSGLLAGLWSSTAAINSLGLTPANGSFMQYSTFYLYGVAKLGTTPAIVPYATGGDTIMTDGTYWYHAFKSSGTFTPTKGLSCDVLVVAGGGGGSWGGGGAGGLYYSSANSIATAQTVTIGAGGAGGGAAHTTRGTNGSNSVFGSLTAAVGGGTGGQGIIGISTGVAGGSGGGGAQATGELNQPGGSATSGQGYAGGTGGPLSGNYGAGGGGGAGAVGGNGTSSVGGVGGVGINTYSTWLNTTGTGVSGYIAGGGGGGADAGAGAGGSGGGGAGSNSTGTAGTANTGGGGGGSSNVAGGVGGSGLVVVRYAV